MADGNKVTLTFAGDSAKLDRTLADVNRSVDKTGDEFEGAAQKAKRFNTSLDGTGEALGNSTGKLRGTADLVGGLGAQFGLPIDGAAAMATNFADMADGMSEALIPALAATKKGMMAMNVAMRANPIGMVIAAIALLGIAFVVAYKKSEKFRAIVHGSLDVVRKIASTVGDAFVRLKDRMLGVFTAIGDAARWLWEHSPLGMLVSNLDKIAGLGSKIGGALGGVAGKFGFASGGQTSGLSLVGERGPELFAGKGTVIPHAKSMGMMGGGSQAIVVQFEGPSDPIFEAFKKTIRVRGGVTAALGGTR
jgi:hypothetical protein